MQMHWQQILPVDRYEVCSSGLIHSYDRKIISLLYQPLIGPVAASLYFTLQSELEANRLWSESSSHHALMSTMDINLKEIYSARVKLEGIGLLKVWKKSGEEENSFIYELMPPLTPQAFFTDGMLNVYLYKKVGKLQFAKLKKSFSDRTVPRAEYEDATKSFQDIFISGHSESLYIPAESAEDLSLPPGQNFIGRQEAVEISGFTESFDFDLLFAGLKESFVPKKAFTPKVREIIGKLAFLYGIDSLNMKNLVLDSVNEHDEIDLEELRKGARDWYQLEFSEQLPSLSTQVQPPQLHTMLEPRTDEEKHIAYLEQVSPRQRLIDLSGGAEPSKADLQIIEDVLLNQRLTPGVANVLIDYVMMKSDMKLSRGYVEKIAGHWARKDIKTVKEAMELAKSEHRQYQAWANDKKTRKPGAKKAIRTEMVPEWLKEDQQDPPSGTALPGAESDDLEERKKRLEEKLKKYQNRG
ncbi:replication initiation and membrane attachment family protein [Peribacillus sp. SCS-37]|uniref:replication initiation and membrane attachment family protein n=1 Tax=Paraperibacillus esterisolvens TaxID=3115296 RepID=UPI0039067352